jgi:hypothetical protein
MCHEIQSFCLLPIKTVYHIHTQRIEPFEGESMMANNTLQNMKSLPHDHRIFRELANKERITELRRIHSALRRIIKNLI